MDTSNFGEGIAYYLLIFETFALLIINIVLIYFKERWSKWIIGLLFINILTTIYFNLKEIDTDLFLESSVLYFPLIILILTILLIIKNIISYKNNPTKYIKKYEREKNKKILLKILIITLTIFFLWKFLSFLDMLF